MNQVRMGWEQKQAVTDFVGDFQFGSSSGLAWTLDARMPHAANHPHMCNLTTVTAG